MNRVFFTADWHFGDPRVGLLGRPFADAGEMGRHIVRCHNETVGPADTVYMLGDAVHKAAGDDVSVLGELNGRIVLFRGNHDLLPDAAYAPYVQGVVAEGDGVELDVAGIRCWLTHYPTQARADLFNLVGHVHGAWRVMPNMLNVGVDAHHFRPLSAEQVRFYYDAIVGIYDDDVWSHAHPANAAHTQRGRRGTYFAQRSGIGGRPER